MYCPNLDDLNQPQLEAVTHPEGPLLVLAGAGSGKTRVITYRIAHLIGNGTAPSAVLAVTFTNKAAGEMLQRCEKLVGGQTRGMWIGTFHAICARLLRMYGAPIGLGRDFVIYDQTDQRTLVDRVLKDFGLSERLFSPSDILGRIDRAKNEGVGPTRYLGEDFVSDVVAKVYPEYERRLRAANAVDFGNLLVRAVELLQTDVHLTEQLSQRFEHVLVDEFQDTNHVQYELLRLLSGHYHNLCVVGDDDQAIYSWRGANIRNILDFERDHPGTTAIKLEQNYRSTQTVLDAAGAVIARNPGRKSKRLWTDRGAGQPVLTAVSRDDRDEATFVLEQIRRLRHDDGRAYGDFAVFYRTHAQSRVLEEAMRAARPPIPHVVVGGIRFYDRAEVKDLLAYLRLIANPVDDVATLRIINVPPRGIGRTTVDKLQAHARQRGATLMQAVQLAAKDEVAAIGTAARKKLKTFRELIDALAADAALPDTLTSDLTEHVFERTGYLQQLQDDDSIESAGRLDNLQELLNSIRDYELRTEVPTLNGYLEQVALASGVDSYAEDEGQVTLMTVHSAKGLEFPHVFIVGLEQGVFPHTRSLGKAVQMEEERRLAYVAMTRARERLYLSRAERRWSFGQPQVNDASEFLRDIPTNLLTAAAGRSGGRPAPRHAAHTATHRPQQRRPAKPQRGADEVWVDYEYAQREPSDEFAADGFRVGMRVRHKQFGVGRVRNITGSPPDLNLTIAFPSGSRTIRSKFVEIVG